MGLFDGLFVGLFVGLFDGIFDKCFELRSKDNEFCVEIFDGIPDGSFTIGAVEGCDDAINDGFVVGAVR